MARRLVVVDLFCGAGGSSTGCLQALDEGGMEALLFVLNHWDVAIKTHKKNHPKARHHKANVFRSDPKKLVPGGKVDLLMASPTCTTFSRARGGKPISWDQRYGRATPTQVLRWVRELDVKCLMVENVPEFLDWGPMLRVYGPWRDGLWRWKPNPSKRGKHFRAWVRRLERLGYKVEVKKLVAADYGDATSRERLFLLARKDGQPIVWPEKTHAKRGAKVQQDLFGGRLKPHKPARDVIDWKILGRSIFREKKPLAAKTLARIYVGMVKECWPQIFLVAMQLYCKAIDVELPEIAAENARAAKATSGAFVFQMNQSRDRARGHKSVEDPLGTITATGTDLGLVQPFQVVLRKHADGKSIDEPIPAACAQGNHVGVAQAFLARSDMHNAESPLPGATTATGGGIALVLPQHGGGEARSTEDAMATIATRGALSLIAAYNRTGKAESVDEPMGTATTHDRFALVTPVTHDDKSNRSRSTEEPLPAVTAAPRGELAFIVGAFGERPGQTPRTHSIDEACPTICAKGRVPLVRALIREWGIDILFRMLEPHELAGAMGFPKGYFDGIKVSKTHKTRLIGNAVPVGVAKALTRALIGVA